MTVLQVLKGGIFSDDCVAVNVDVCSCGGRNSDNATWSVWHQDKRRRRCLLLHLWLIIPVRQLTFHWSVTCYVYWADDDDDDDRCDKSYIISSVLSSPQYHAGSS